MFITPAFAQTGPVAGGTGAIMQFLPLILIFLIMYFLILRPQQKRVRVHRDMVGALKRGDQVVTQGGILGKVTDVKDAEAVIEIAQARGLPLQLRALPAAELRGAREVFVSSSAGGVLSVTRVDGVPVGAGVPGPVTRQLEQTYWDWHRDPRYSLAVNAVAAAALPA